MAITFLAAKRLLAQYADRGGLCEDETPLKVKINGAGGSVWSMWFRYYDQKDLAGECFPAAAALTEIPNYFPTVYDLPSGGAQVGAIATECEAEDAYVIVKGLDTTGREVFSERDGEQFPGAYLPLRKGMLVTSLAAFGRIDHVVKSRTKGYVQLMAVRPDLNSRHFLADYTPFEEVPAYRRYRLTIPCASNATVEVLGRIRLKDHYADSDPIPVENILALRTAAQKIQAGTNKDYQGAQINDQEVEKLLVQENNYKKPTPGQPMDVYQPTSPGSIRNPIGSGWISPNWFRRR
jgi:hypothetical protein